jgi:hypothetical protein
VDSATAWMPLVGIVIVGAFIWFLLGRSRRTPVRDESRGSGAAEPAARTEADVRAAEGDSSPRRVDVKADSEAPRSARIRPLSTDDRARYGDSWRRIQSQFVDDPKGAVTQADRLVGETMTARGYPVWDFERHVDDFAAEHPEVVINYRAARDIAGEHQRGNASTEDLRQAMVHYHALFVMLLGPDVPPDDRDRAERERREQEEREREHARAASRR